jgi:hypothetical protein
MSSTTRKVGEIFTDSIHGHCIERQGSGFGEAIEMWSLTQQ